MEALQRAGASSGQIIFLTGEPGIGKTALADAFLSRVRGAIRASSLPAGAAWSSTAPARPTCPGSTPSAPCWRVPIGSESSACSGSAPPPGACNCRGPSPRAGFTSNCSARPSAPPSSACSANWAMHRALAVGTPLVLLLEDLHWADPSSVDLLRHLGQRIVGQRLLVVGTYRTEDVERGNHPLKSCRLELQAHGLCDGLALGSLSHENLAGYLDCAVHPE